MKYLTTKIVAIAVFFMACTGLSKAQTITITSVPPAATIFTTNISLRLILSETPKETQLIIKNTTIGSADSGKVWTLIMKTAAANYNPVTIPPFDLGNTSNTFYALPNNVPMPDGTYSASAQYTRVSNGVTITSTSPKTFTLDARTITPTIIAPLSNSYLGNNFVFRSNSKELVLAGSKKLKFVKNGDTTLVVLNNQSDTITFNINDLAGSSAFNIASATPNQLAEGLYQKIILTDQDTARHAAAADTIYNVTIDTSITAPTIVTPADGALLKTSFDVTFDLPEKAATNSVKMVFIKNGESDTLVVSNTAAGNHTITIYPDHLNSSTNAVSSNATSLKDGAYLLKLFFTDMIGLTDSAQSSLILQTDSITMLPALTAPADNATELVTAHISFTLPEGAAANSVQVEFIGCADNTITLDATTAGEHTYALTSTNLLGSPGVVSAVPNNVLGTGVYNVLLSYQDTAGNPRSYTLAKKYNFNNGTLGLNFNMLKGYLDQAKTHLQWETETESDLAYFDVQFSKDAKSFANVGKVKAVGTSFIKQDYSFVHNDPTLAKSYYRLNMIDKDGTQRYSPVIVVYADNAAEEFKVFPNPTAGKLNVSIITGNTTDTHILKVWDMDGKLVKTMTVQAGNGSGLFSFSIDDLSNGNYVLQDGNNVTLFAKRQ